MGNHPTQSLLTIVVIAVMSAAVTGVAWYMNYQAIHASADQFARIKGQSLLQLIQTTRLWNSKHGGVYVPVTDSTQPNPYLSIGDRDITDSLGRQLTKVNPAYMTRQISELLGGGVKLRMTSLNPLNPVNEPDEWERRALLEFQAQHQPELMELVGEEYRYIAPLYVKVPCLQCHQRQGYALGDLRGGMSFRFPVSDSQSLVEQQVLRSTRFHVMAFFIIFALGSGLFLSVNFYNAKLRASNARNQSLEVELRIDGLTGVLNHNAIVEVAEQELKRALRGYGEMCVMMVDLDHFKRVNDSYGHQAGDEVLASTTDMICHHLREVDVMGRYGGEEFLVVLPGTSLENALVVAERIREAIAEQKITLEDGRSVSITASFGLAQRIDTDADVVKRLIRRADEALYDAKRGGRDRVVASCGLSPA